jgi:hypothetical protein
MTYWSLEKYCKSNLNDPKCGCMNPPPSVVNIAQITSQPYYCWYKPCFESDNFISFAIQKAQLGCQITNCQISIADISIKGGRINIANICGSMLGLLTTNQINVDLTPYPWSFMLPLINNFSAYAALGLIMSAFVLSTRTRD